MKYFIITLLTAVIFIGCKKDEAPLVDHGSITARNIVFEFSQATMDSITYSEIIDGKIIWLLKMVYTLSSEDGKNTTVLSFTTTKKQFASGEYFINFETLEFGTNTIRGSYQLVEDYGQNRTNNTAKGTLFFQKKGDREILQFTTKGDSKVIIKWDGIVKDELRSKKEMK